MRCAEGAAVSFCLAEIRRFPPGAAERGDYWPNGSNGEGGGNCNPHWLPRRKRKHFGRNKMVVVTRGGAFYNPSITVLDIVVMLSVVRSSPPSRTDVYSTSECLSI